ncbi:MAG: hypothetical protein ACI81V_000667 [Lentimonas sp.]|jgi:hypothetical protein
MFAVTLLLFVLASILSATAFLIKSGYAIGNYVSMEGNSRFTTECLYKDLIATVKVVTAEPAILEMTVRDPDYNENTVRYEYKSDRGELSRTLDSETPKILAHNVSSFAFSYYTSKKDEKASRILDVKNVEFLMGMTDSVLGNEQQRELTSARYVLRNRATD